MAKTDSPGRSTEDELSPTKVDKLKATRFAPVANDDALEEFTEVNEKVLHLWLRRARRKLRNGVTVIKVTNTGKLVRRQFYIGAKPEYIELISSKLFDIAYHLTDVTRIEHGLESPDFDTYWKTTSERVPKKERSLIIYVSGVSLSLVFLSESDRRDAEFLLRVERRATMNRYREIAAKLEGSDVKLAPPRTAVAAS